ncbi:BBP7 family outer membrane beta-barrel protein [Anatilimnocola floriformis]|uniref:BBP7 family outer membrane beta-barrel protein n=1 Tax=Anatilimnocola floriformis TaxID=2948575 RepID=UPI0020C5B248|nr:BBP7 family outer membrane beta-barrel protein [Anatilimnocola floriformis]
MFANLSKLTSACTLLALVAFAVPANAQQQRVAVRSNPNIQRPMPVAARSISQPPTAMARVVRQETLPPGDPALRTPPAAILQGDGAAAPANISPSLNNPSAGPPVMYDDGMMFDEGYGGGFDGGMYPNMWARPMMPMLGGMSLSIRGEVLYWWTSAMNTPVLATSSPANVAVGEAGVLGEPGTNALLGTQLNDNARAGGRFFGNMWFDPMQNWGLEASYTFLPGDDTNFSVNSNQLPVIARPFFNAETGLNDAELVAYPGLLTGNLSINAESFFSTGDLAVRWNVGRDNNRRVDLMAGYRFAYLRDKINIREKLTSISQQSGVVPGTTIVVHDDFDAANYFNGVEIGIAGQRDTFLGLADFWLKTSLGNTRTKSNISGSTTTTANGQTATTNDGFLALPTNEGQRKLDEFSTLIELGGKINRDFGPWRASVGYSVLLWSSVGRGGDLIDLNVNTSQLPPGPLTGAGVPKFHDRQTSFWAQGVTFGLERAF